LVALHASQVKACDELRQANAQALEAKQLAGQALAERATASTSVDAEIQELRAEQQTLVERLAEAESNLAKADSQRNDDLQRRFELAVEDVRSLKRRNAELEEEALALKASAARPATATPASSDAPGWEAMKRQMMESLEADVDPSDSRAEERLSIEHTIAITDDVVAGKDHEIAELKLLLSQQGNNISEAAVAAAQVVSAIDHDAVILQERGKLAELQEEWRKKLRQAEIDISVERAKITRDRAEIEDKLAAYEKERASQVGEGESNGAESPAAKKPTRGRWLARLGLKDENG
jgi:hypothetical protein